MNDRQHIESYMVTKANTMTHYDWWQAGRQAGTAPTLQETVDYGLRTATGWLDQGGDSMDQAIGKGFDAMYRYAYADIRDTITRQGQLRRPGSATPETDVYSLTILNSEEDVFDVLDWVARAPLTQDQKRLVVMYSLGWSLSEAADDLGLAYTNVRRWFRAALPILRGQL